jgi:hypothetical protein
MSSRYLRRHPDSGGPLSSYEKKTWFSQKVSSRASTLTFFIAGEDSRRPVLTHKEEIPPGAFPARSLRWTQPRSVGHRVDVTYR